MLRNRKVAEGTPAPWFLTGHVTVRVSPPWLRTPSLASHCSYHTALPARPAGKTRWGGEAAPAYSYWKLSVSQKSSLSGLHVSCSDLNSNWHCISEQKFALPSSWKLCSQPPDSPRTLSIAIFPHLPHDLLIPTIPTSHPPRTRVLLKLSSVRICPP